MSGNYILEGKTPVRCHDIVKWARWFEKTDRRVNYTAVGDASVSTIFLGVDHQFGVGPPILFETMVFGGPLDGEQNRYPTWEEAERGHFEMVGQVTKATSGVTLFRIRWKKLGGHIHCRMFTSSGPDQTYGKNGELTFHEGDEWTNFCIWAKRWNVELIEEQ